MGSSRLLDGFRIGALALIGMALSHPDLSAAPKIQSWHTSNGAKVLFVAAPELPILDVRVVFDAGSARDGEKPGLASMTNSLLSEGAGDWSADEVAERLENVGAQLGSGSLRDMAWISMRTLTDAKALDIALDTLNAILVRPKFDTADIERQREAILSSLRQDEQSPGAVGRKALFRRVFEKHPYASDPDGTTESVASLTSGDLVGAYKRFYVAANAVLALVGAIDREQAEDIAERVVRGLPQGEHASPLPSVAALTEPAREHIDFPSTQSHIYVGQPGMRRGDPDYFPLHVGNHVLGGSGLVSQLSEEVRERRGLSYSVSSYFSPMRSEGIFLMGLQTKNAQAEEALAVATEAVSRFVEKGPSDDELEAAKRNITGGFPLRISSNKKIVEYLAMIGFYDLPLDYLDRFNERVDAVTLEQVRDAFQRRVQPQRLATVIVGPKSEQRKTEN